MHGLLCVKLRGALDSAVKGDAIIHFHSAKVHSRFDSDSHTALADLIVFKVPARHLAVRSPYSLTVVGVVRLVYMPTVRLLPTFSRQ
jgi:hypothetical protein